MRWAELVRHYGTADGVFGTLGSWVTVEEENKGNKPNISCIPEGAYVCKRRMYHKGGYETFEVTGVPGRSAILFHKANTEEDLEGCIGVTSSLGVLNVVDEDTKVKGPKLAGLNSGDAFNAFMAHFHGVNEWILVVRWGATNLH